MKILTLCAISTLFVIAAAFFLIGPERVWEWVGPADLGPVSFETLERRATPNDALACPPGINRARTDPAPPEFSVGAKSLRAAFGWKIAPKVELPFYDARRAAGALITPAP